MYLVLIRELETTIEEGAIEGIGNVYIMGAYQSGSTAINQQMDHGALNSNWGGGIARYVKCIFYLIFNVARLQNSEVLEASIVTCTCSYRKRILTRQGKKKKKKAFRWRHGYLDSLDYTIPS